MGSRWRNVLTPGAAVSLIALFTGCGPTRAFDDDGPFSEKTYLPPLVSFHQTEDRWPATKSELRSFCIRQGIDMNPGFRDHVQMAPANDSLVILWHKGDDYVTQRWRLVDGKPRSEAISFEEAKRTLRLAR